MPRDIHVLVLIGLTDSNTVEVTGLRRGDFDFSFTGNLMLFRHLDCTGINPIRVPLGGPVGRIQQLPQADLIFNAVCDADDNSRALEHAGQIVEALGLPVINRPQAVRHTTRERTAGMLHDLALLQVPRVLRVRPERQSDVEAILAQGRMTYPFIMRRAGGHNGHTMLLVRNEAELWRTERFAFDGTEYYMIEFVDYRDDDGWYRKYRFLIIDGEVYPRHVLADHEWIIHASCRFKAMAEDVELQRQEREFLENFASRLGAERLDQLRILNQRLGLDYLGVDCSLRPDGRLLVFETNACVNAFTQTRRETGTFAYLEGHVDRIGNAARELVFRRARQPATA